MDTTPSLSTHGVPDVPLPVRKLSREDFALYAKSQGWAKHPTLRATDLPPRNPQKAITVHTAAEIDLLLSAARGKGLRWWAFLTFLADTGGRGGGGLSLQWDWLRLEESPPYFQLPVQKNGRPQYLPLGTRLREEVFTPDHVAVLQSREHDNFTCDPSVHPFHCTYPSVRSLMISHCQTVGLTHRVLHVLRHTRATQWLASGVPLNAVSKLLGHSNVAI